MAFRATSFIIQEFSSVSTNGEASLRSVPRRLTFGPRDIFNRGYARRRPCALAWRSTHSTERPRQRSGQDARRGASRKAECFSRRSPCCGFQQPGPFSTGLPVIGTDAFRCHAAPGHRRPKTPKRKAAACDVDRKRQLFRVEALRALPQKPQTHQRNPTDDESDHQQKITVLFFHRFPLSGHSQAPRHRRRANLDALPPSLVYGSPFSDVTFP